MMQTLKEVKLLLTQLYSLAPHFKHSVTKIFYYSPQI